MNLILHFAVNNSLCLVATLNMVLLLRDLYSKVDHIALTIFNVILTVVLKYLNLLLATCSVPWAKIYLIYCTFPLSNQFIIAGTRHINLILDCILRMHLFILQAKLLLQELPIQK